MSDEAATPASLDTTEPSRLRRALGTRDAVIIGLGAMIGAGVFAAIGPAAGAAGAGLLIGLAIAGAVAYCNAASSAQLAALYPQAGGTYVYGRERLGQVWGFFAGWAFVSGKLASCAAIALTFGAYAAPGLERPLAIAAVVGLTAVNYRGVRKTALLTQAIVFVVLAALAATVTAGFVGGALEEDGLRLPSEFGGPRGTLQAGALLFFAFAGYARIATLGEEVRDPATTIPKAIPIALGITLVVYAAVAATALVVLPPDELADASAPLAAVIEAGRLAVFSPIVRIGATIATLGVLLSLMVGVSRTTFAMSSNRELPRWFSAVHPTHRVPHHAEMAVAAIVCGAVLVTDVRGAIGFSSFNVLLYYAIANASALTLSADERRWPAWIPAAGLAGCLLLAISVPLDAMAVAAVILAAGMVAWLLNRVTSG
jgi:basic amino acid/polyamine antiporter, APA family